MKFPFLCTCAVKKSCLGVPVQSVQENRLLILILKHILCHLAYTIFMCVYNFVQLH
jgi:hypothetical protein